MSTSVIVSLIKNNTAIRKRRNENHTEFVDGREEIYNILTGKIYTQFKIR